ncbi:Pectinesterase [Heracleum sosnowskyi]|uniref:Pectinesterase n=1 Tax=Heracleum sosnowskyi TaxID=360622 RepID=A0AAD8IIS2_9APIA|nr:Pectinesterase [Heracleum sosnowskyi]
MKIQMSLSLTFLLTICIVFPHVHSSLNTTGDLNWWCNQTPNPNPCNYHTSHIPESASATNISRKQFLTIAEQTALDAVISELGYIKSLEPRVINDGERAAWSDCLLFYNLTINSLSKILNVTTKSTAADIQVWLTAASTSILTCQDGFSDVNVTTNIYPLVISNNVTQLIKNCLSLNMVFFDQEKGHMQKGVSKFFPPNNSLFENADCVVAQDGSGDYTTITEALEASKNRQDVSQRFVIQVKQGTYAEYPVVTDDMKNIVLVGDGIDNTIVTGNQRAGANLTLTDTATFQVYGDGFVAKDITFENTAGVDAGQAIALYSQADQSAFYLCGFRGYQDTLMAAMNRQFYRECKIYGTVDYIFGNAAVVFQQSTIFASKPDGGLVITAQARTDSEHASGTVIQNCSIVAGPDLLSKGTTYLGRPWRDYSTVVIMQSFLDSIVNPEGWLEWPGAGSTRDSTVFYAEFDNTGPGSATDGRVNWPGYHVITDSSDVKQYSVANFIDGESWLPNTGVPFDSGI